VSAGGVRRWLVDPAAATERVSEGRSPRTVAGFLALAGVGVLAGVRIGLNLPTAMPIAFLYPGALGLATIAPALALVVLGTTSTGGLQQVVALFAGVFGLLAVVAEPAVVPATIAIMAGVIGIAGVEMKAGWVAQRVGRSLVVATLSIGALLSLAAGLGLDTATLRPMGSRVVLLGIAGSPLLLGWDREAAVVGIGAGIAMLAAGLSAPFLTGAISLVVGGVVGVSLPLLVLAAVGVATLGWTALRAGRTEMALAAGILLVAGIPATLPRGLAFLTAVLLLGGDSR